MTEIINVARRRIKSLPESLLVGVILSGTLVMVLSLPGADASEQTSLCDAEDFVSDDELLAEGMDALSTIIETIEDFWASFLDYADSVNILNIIPWASDEQQFWAQEINEEKPLRKEQ